MTAVEQRGPRVYASPMAKKLAETQKLRLEGKFIVIASVNTHSMHKNDIDICPSITALYLCVHVFNQDKAVVSSVQLHLRILQEEVQLRLLQRLAQSYQPVLPMLIFL